MAEKITIIIDGNGTFGTVGNLSPNGHQEGRHHDSHTLSSQGSYAKRYVQALYLRDRARGKKRLVTSCNYPDSVVHYGVDQFETGHGPQKDPGRNVSGTVAQCTGHTDMSRKPAA